MCTRINGLEYYSACRCAGTGCGGHLVLNPAFATIAPIGWQGPAQHTFTTACDGHHPPGPCMITVPIRVPAGTTIDGAIVALCPDEAGVVTADVCIDGPPRP